MATFKCDIPHKENELIKEAAKNDKRSRQKFIEKLIIDAALKQSKKV